MTTRATRITDVLHALMEDDVQRTPAPVRPHGHVWTLAARDQPLIETGGDVGHVRVLTTMLQQHYGPVFVHVDRYDDTLVDALEPDTVTVIRAAGEHTPEADAREAEAARRWSAYATRWADADAYARAWAACARARRAQPTR